MHTHMHAHTLTHTCTLTYTLSVRVLVSVHEQATHSHRISEQAAGVPAHSPANMLALLTTL